MSDSADPAQDDRGEHGGATSGDSSRSSREFHNEHLGRRTISFQSPLGHDRHVPPQLVVVEGPIQGQVFDLAADSQTLGRHDACEIVLPSVTVSRRHATIHRQGSQLFIVDEDSSNGVYINGAKIPAGQSCSLQHGDILRLGEFMLLVKHETTLKSQLGLSSIHLDADKVRQEVDDFLRKADKPADHTPE